MTKLGLNLGIEGPRQHCAAGFRLLTGAVEPDMRHDFRKIAERKIHRREQAKRRLWHGGRL